MRHSVVSHPAILARGIKHLQDKTSRETGTDPVLSQVTMKNLADLTYSCATCGVNHVTGYRCRADRKVSRAIGRIALVRIPADRAIATTVAVRTVR